MSDDEHIFMDAARGESSKLKTEQLEHFMTLLSTPEGKEQFCKELKQRYESLLENIVRTDEHNKQV